MKQGSYVKERKMSTLVIPTQDNARGLNRESLITGEVGRVGEKKEAMPGTEALTEVMVPLSTASPLYKLAELISALYCRLFGATVYDADPLEEPDSSYPSGWCCCM